MNKAELIAAVVAKTALTRKEAETAIAAVTESITEALVNRVMSCRVAVPS